MIPSIKKAFSKETPYNYKLLIRSSFIKNSSSKEFLSEQSFLVIIPLEAA